MMRPECVLLTDDHLPHLGGSRLYAHHVASRMDHALGIVTRTHPGDRDLDASLDYQTVRVHLRGGIMAGPAFVGEFLDALALARAALRSFPSAQCFLASEMTPSALAAAFAGRRLRVPYGLILHDEPLMGAGRVEERLRRRLVRGASVIVASSSFPKTRASQLTSGSAPVFLAPPGVETSLFEPGEPSPGVLARWRARRGGYLLCVGRLVDYKNIAAVIRALAEFDASEISLVVVGQGHEKPVLASLAYELGLGGRVVFAGRVSREELVHLYRGALAYVFPSKRALGRRHEGIGMAALEAASCGCPVIASSETSACDFVEHGRSGLLFDPYEPGALEAAIGVLISKPQKRLEMARRCSETVRHTFTWDRTAATVKQALAHMKRPPLTPNASSCLG